MGRRGCGKRSVRSLAVGWLAMALACATAPVSAAWTQMSKLQARGAQVSAAVMDLQSGQMLATKNADSRLSPASLSKLVIAAAALDTWPASKTFRTRVYGLAPLKNGEINGDLLLHGEHDATFQHRDLLALSAQIVGAGVKAIHGGITVSTAPFGALGCETKDRCDALEQSGTAYHAPLSAMGVDYGTWCVMVKPLRPGLPADVRACGGAPMPIPMEGKIKTISAKGKQTFWVERLTDAGGDRLRLSGNAPARAPTKLFRAMSDPSLGAGLLLRAHLREMGIRILGPVGVSSERPPANAQRLAQVESLSLKEQIGRMMRFSNNYVADVLTLSMDKHRTGQAADQLADASNSLNRFVHRTQGEHRQSQPPSLLSGSGLTPESRISAAELVRMLAYQYRDTRNFPAFYGSLTVPRQAPFRYVRQGNADWLDRVALKTGSMSQPRSVLGLSGYMRKKNGGWMAFATIVNGGPQLKRVPMHQAMQASRKDLEALMRKY